MEFAKYYNVSNLVEEMQKLEEIDCYPTDNGKFEGVYICMDTNDFWISRINKGYNEEYEPDFIKFYEELLKQPEEEAKNLALVIERYVVRWNGYFR